MTSEQRSGAVCVSMGIFAWNEERVIVAALDSLFGQSFFEELRRRQARCEVLCVVNGCSDRTPLVASEIFERQRHLHPAAESFCARVVELKERGKVNAWNQFVHRLSAPGSEFLFMMDADILLHRADTLWNMLRTLEEDPQAAVAVDRPCKDIQFQSRRSWRGRLSLAASQMTQKAEGQLCGQLYCIRSGVARNIYLPRDLAACEDGFIKALVCTDFLAHEVWPLRIRLADEAEHTFEAYTTPGAIFRNQKRQVLGQTIVHILVDDFLKRLPSAERERLAETLRARDAADPAWLKRLISAHLERTRFFWRLYPGLPGQRFQRLRRLGWRERLRYLPAAAAGTGMVLLAGFMARRALKRGCTDYWPRAERAGLRAVGSAPAQGWQLTASNTNQD